MTTITQLPLFDNDSPLPKQCSKCKEWFPLTPEFWYKSKITKDGYHGWCKQCNRENACQWAKDHPEKNREKSKQWYKNHPEKAKEQSRQWHKDNPEKVKETQARFRQNHPDRLREIKQNWAKNHPENGRKQSKRYAEKHPEKGRERIKKWRAENGDKIKEYSKRKYHENLAKSREKSRIHANLRRTKIQINGGEFTEIEIEALRLEQNNCCYHCGVSFDDKPMEIDHWIPIDKGGTSWISNIKLLCRRCNRSKGHKLPHEWSDRYDEDGNITQNRI